MSQHYRHHTLSGAPSQARYEQGLRDWHGHSDWYQHHLNEDATARRWPALLGWGAAFVLCAWLVAASAYTLFHDDLLREALNERARMQAAYETRITTLRMQADSINGRLMLDQDGFDRKLEGLRLRQMMLEQRQSALGSLLEQARTASMAAAMPMVADADDADMRPGEGQQSAQAGTPADPLQISGRVIRLAFKPRITRAAGSRANTGLASAGLPGEPNNAADAGLIRLARSQEKLETDQIRSLNSLESRTGGAVRLIADQISGLGIAPSPSAMELANVGATRSVAPGLVTASLGGPFIPVRPGQRTISAFDQQVRRIQLNIARAESLFEQLNSLPVHRPLKAGSSIVSSFGQRLDPFLRTPALHNGIDFRASHGDQVYATAPGKVVRAGAYGGYGQVVDIRHSSGFFTRYAHLSALHVEEGELVQAGTAIGRVGSTGRSTGPHLHYEVHAHDEPVDPQTFMKISAKFGL